MTDGLLQSKVIIVTGAARGVGLATVALMVQEGACVVAVDVDGVTLDKASGQLSPKKGCYLGLVIDVAAEGSAREIARRTIEEFGGVDGLINAAAVQTPGGSILEASDADWDRYLDVNLRSVVRLCRVAIPLMIQRGGGTIVNIGSISSIVAIPRQVAYAVSKAALLQLTRSITVDFGPRGIRANCICPGPILSGPVLAARSMSEALADPALQALAAAHPDGTLASTHDIAEAAVFLTGPMSRHVCGTVLVVDGGITVSAAMP